MVPKNAVHYSVFKTYHAFYWGNLQLGIQNHLGLANVIHLKRQACGPDSWKVEGLFFPFVDVFGWND